ncbi:hypothetical protein SLEP1_g56328 [Rubroshorea leprosula]|uniref:Leucine-rich repeat-containing N-terminal plant-type domain-containing protein n=1 Tax=Rubroshorea leprosula TaxID=152421 RepID=A0AAV5MJC6_9ROSI|nr:hypothetical protein SLEP1_g56328 [Rubroshorea leprosula]
MVSYFAYFLFFTILLGFFFQPCFQHPLCQRDERVALLQFKESFVIDKHASSDDDPCAYHKVNLWKSQAMDCCSWEGIWCDQDTGHVIGLDLSSSCLFGSINSNSSLFHLIHLQHLNLAFNHFNYSKIPYAFANLTTLTYLNLSKSFFSGQIPFELSKLASLSTLDLSDSCIFGLDEGLLELKRPNMRSLIENMTSLEYLRLTCVKINSRIPNMLANMSSLRTIRLGSCGLFGEFPSAIFQLPKLQVLIVSYNHGLMGNLPEFHFNSQLMTLGVGITSFSGKLPTSIGMLSSLEQLYVYGCNFSGLLPPSLGNLTKLQQLVVEENSFIGTIEIETFLKLKYLNTLLLSSNNFSLDQDQLESLEVPFNDITGQIPQWISCLPSFSALYILDLSFNMLEASLPIPPFSINFFLVSGNKFSGEIPPEFCSRTSLVILDLSHNNLHGMIPQCISNFSKSLLILNLQENSFEGPIPTSWVAGNNIKEIKLGQNNLQGKLPKSLTNCRMLEFLDLGNNHIRDTFPSWLGTLPNLKILILHSNGFYGPINVPKSDAWFPNLRIIDLSYNGFIGLLPIEYFKMWDAIANVDKANTVYWHTSDYFQLMDGGIYTNPYPYSMTITNKGVKMEYAKVLEIFSAIDLSCNKFEGEILDVIGSLKGLQLLNLSNNILVGPIPQALGDLKNLEALDLSQNKLTGSIPTQLTQLNFLEVFNISHNQLTGTIPTGQQFDTFDNSSFYGNSGLCGLPLSRKCDDSKGLPPPSSTSKGNEDSGLLAEFGWKTVALGYGCGFVVGVVIGNIVFARRHEWLMRTYRIRLSRGRRMRRIQ